MSDELVPDHQVDMRLNGEGPLAPGATAPPPPLLQSPSLTPPPLLKAPGGQDFASTPAEKEAAANTIQYELQPHTQTAADHADESTGAAQKGFDGWETAAGLKTVAETWDQQVKNLIARLEAEKNALRGASGLVARNDIGLRNDFLATKSKLHGV
ncbi:hypothetical protein [Streptomyces sp. BR123]|uniref:hypothetical protein n=1 Tax=Streptomyces sp. BR123 TaxID=2749828 RepID=UPI00211B1B94|nr:hypothetical protein [Streptomyces sp. BR123]